MSTVVRQLAPRARCLLQCLLTNTVGLLCLHVGRSEKCAQEFAPQSHIHSGLNQREPISSDVFLAHSDQYVDGSTDPCQVFYALYHSLWLSERTENLDDQLQDVLNQTEEKNVDVI